MDVFMGTVELSTPPLDSAQLGAIMRIKAGDYLELQETHKF